MRVGGGAPPTVTEHTPWNAHYPPPPVPKSAFLQFWWKEPPISLFRPPHPGCHGYCAPPSRNYLCKFNHFEVSLPHRCFNNPDLINVHDQQSYLFRGRSNTGHSNQGRNEVRWRPGQEASFAPPYSHLGTFGSKLYWRKYLWHCWDFLPPPIVTQGIAPPSLRPWLQLFP